MTRYRYRLITFGLMALAAMLLSAVAVMMLLLPYLPPKLILHCDFHLIAACIGAALLCVFAQFHLATMSEEWSQNPRWEGHRDWEATRTGRVSTAPSFERTNMLCAGLVDEGTPLNQMVIWCDLPSRN